MTRTGWIVCIALLWLPVGTHGSHAETQHTDASSRGWPISDFELRDQRGQPFTAARLQGRWTFLLLGDTHCGTPCANALAGLAGMYRRIDNTQKLATTQVVFVSLDPARDTPATLRRYLEPYDARFVGVTGTAEALAPLVDDLGGKPGAHHPGSLVLIAPDGTVRSRFLPPFEVSLLTAEYLKTRVRK